MDQPTVMPGATAPSIVYVPVPSGGATGRNGLGVFGCLIAFVGLFIPTGIVALLGLILSLIAVGRAPRGFALAGVIFGVLGTLLWLVIMIGAVVVALVGALAIGVAGAAGFALAQPDVVEVTSDMVNIAIATDAHREERGAWPRSVEELALSTSTTTDPWGQSYRLTRIDAEPGFDVVSFGPDGSAGTDDDLSLTTLDRTWEDAIARFEAQLEALDAHRHHAGGCGADGPRGTERDYVRKALESMDAIPLHD